MEGNCLYIYELKIFLLFNLTLNCYLFIYFYCIEFIGVTLVHIAMQVSSGHPNKPASAHCIRAPAIQSPVSFHPPGSPLCPFLPSSPPFPPAVTILLFVSVCHKHLSHPTPQIFKFCSSQNNKNSVKRALEFESKPKIISQLYQVRL